MPRKILILANHYNTLRIFRRELLEELHRQGHELVVSIPPCDEENQKILEGYGCRIIPTPEMERRGMNPIQDMSLLKRYRAILRAERPDVTVAYTIKSNIYGGLACQMCGVPFYANITGLGSAFASGNTKVRRLVSFLYRISLRRARGVFFQNQGNLDTLVGAGIIRPEQAILMPGSGVNLQAFAPVPYPEERESVRFLFVGRIMQEKGVDELFTAIRRLKPRYPQAQFEFIGWYEDSYQQQVEQMQAEGLIRFHGFQPEVRPYIESCHCIVLPSWHEGMSNTLLEGAAMARPLITNRIHGCMEAVHEGMSGYLCEKLNAADLAEKLETFINLPWETRRDMGAAGRRHVEKHFDKQYVVRKTIRSLRLVGAASTPAPGEAAFLAPSRILFTCTDLMTVQFLLPHIVHQHQLGNHVELLCSNVGNRVEDIMEQLRHLEAVKVHVVSLRRSPLSLANIKGYRELKDYLRRNRFDLIVTNEPVMGVATRLAARKYRPLTRVIYTVHGFHFYRGAHPLLHWLFKTVESFMARYTDAIVTINAEDYQAALNFKKCQPALSCHMIHGVGADLNKFPPLTAAEKLEQREKEGFSSEDVLMVFAGELNANKNQQLLIRGMVEIHRRYPQAKLLLAGKGDQLPRLRELVAELRLEDVVFFLGYRKDINRVIGMCDIGVSSSIREGLGLNMIESMACGLPIICSDNRAHRELIDGGKSGCMFRLHSHESFTAAFIELMEQRNIAEISQHNITYSDTFSLARAIEHYGSIISQNLL